MVLALTIPFAIFFVFIFIIRFYMIWTTTKSSHALDHDYLIDADEQGIQIHTSRGAFTFFTVFAGCLKFWDSTLLVKAYFGNTTQDEMKRRINDKRQMLGAYQNRQNVQQQRSPVG